MLKQILKSIIVFFITLEARLVLKKYKPKIVAVTGSVGKTSTKEAIAVVLENKFKIRKSQKSYNSEIGVPLVVLGCESGWRSPFLWLSNITKGLKLVLFKKDYPEWLILELGVERPKDIERLVSWIKPDIAVVTALAELPTHVEFFIGPQALIKEKAKLLSSLEVGDIAILNSDDEAVYELREKTKAEVTTFGFGPSAVLRASDYAISLRGISFKVNCEGSIVPIRLTGAWGRHHVYPSLAALAVGRILKMNFINMAEALTNYQSPAGRLKLLEGVKGSLIIDDSYNSSPLALCAALDTLKDISAERKIVVLGDMLELGKYTIEAHKSIAKDIIESGVEIVFTVGSRAKFIADGLREKDYRQTNIYSFPTADKAKKEVENIIRPGDLVLVKGSQSMRMERVVEEIMAHPEKKNELLVRQEKEWLNKP